MPRKGPPGMQRPPNQRMPSWDLAVKDRAGLRGTAVTAPLGQLRAKPRVLREGDFNLSAHKLPVSVERTKVCSHVVMTSSSSLAFLRKCLGEVLYRLQETRSQEAEPVWSPAMADAAESLRRPGGGPGSVHPGGLAWARAEAGTTCRGLCVRALVSKG